MKRSAVIGILLFVLMAVAVFFGAFFITYREMQKNFADRDEEFPAVEAAGQDIVTNDRTEYVMETYDIQTHAISEETEHIPVEYIGCTREEIADLLEQYEEDPSIEDLEAGFVDYSLVFF